MAAAISFPAKVNQKTKRRERKKSLERISTRNVVEISGVLPENEIKNEIKNIYCFLKMGEKKIPSLLDLKQEQRELMTESPGVDVSGTGVC